MATAASTTHDRALDALLAGYAAGSLSLPMSTLIASHLTMSSVSRAFVAHLEAAYGAMVDLSEPVPLRDARGMLAAVLAERGEAIRACGPAARRAETQAAFPPPLARYLGYDWHGAPWRIVVPGLKECAVEESDRGEAKLIWVGPGRSMRRHSHAGIEAMLVLCGGFMDLGGRYRRGDVAVVDSRIEHGGLADAGEDCICFAVTEGSPQWAGLAEGALDRITGH